MAPFIHAVGKTFQMRNWDHQFWLKVWPRGDCWEWRGTRFNKMGYGAFSIGGENVSAHRMAYEIAKGTIPGHLEIDHLCRHPWCVRPSHLEAVTPKVNLSRSMAISTVREKSTACPNGHAYTPENTMLVRCCKTCLSARSVAYARRKRDRMRGILDR